MKRLEGLVVVDGHRPSVLHAVALVVGLDNSTGADKGLSEGIVGGGPLDDGVTHELLLSPVLELRGKRRAPW